MTDIAILENKEAVKYYISEFGERDKIKPIATTPSACWELEKNNIKYVKIEDYYKKEWIITEGLKNFNIVDGIAGYLDETFKHKNKIAKYNLKPGYDNYFYIKQLYDALFTRYHFISKIIEKETPDRVITFCFNDCTSMNKYLPFNNYESIYTYIFDEMPVFEKIHHKYIIENTTKPKEKYTININLNDFLTKLKKIANINLIYWPLYILKTYGAAAFILTIPNIILNTIFSKKIIYTHGYGYDWNSLSPKLILNGYNIKKIKSQNDDFSSDFALQIEIGEILHNSHFFNNISFEGIFVKNLSIKLSEYLHYCKYFSEKIDLDIKSNNIKIGLFGTKSHFIDNITAHILKYNDVPVLSYQHGAQGYNFTPILKYVELQNSDIHFCFGKGVQEMINACFNVNNIKIIPTGSYSLKNIFFRSYISKIPQNDIKILYITTNYYLNNNYISAPFLIQDNELFGSQRKIIDFLAKNKYKATIKLHPSNFSNEIIIDYIRYNNYNNIETVITGSCSELFEKFNVVIVDFPSTVLLQALSYKKMTFVLTKHYPLPDDTQELLNECAICSEDVDDLMERIEDFLNDENINKIYSNLIENTKFLEKFGIGELDEGKDIEDEIIGILDYKLSEK